MAKVKERFGRLDVLVNNAGTTASWKPRDLETLSLEDWDRVFAVNVRGLWQVTQLALAGMSTSEVSRLWLARWHSSHFTLACFAWLKFACGIQRSTRCGFVTTGARPSIFTV